MGAKYKIETATRFEIYVDKAVDGESVNEVNVFTHKDIAHSVFSSAVATLVLGIHDKDYDYVTVTLEVITTYSDETEDSYTIQKYSRDGEVSS